MTIIEDKPIHALHEDQYGRGHLVEALAATIQAKAQEPHSCYTIGIYGPWGEGKTSVLNMLQDRLLALKGADAEGGDIREDNIVICRYNPWMINGQDALIQEFFDCICVDQKAELAELLKKYGGIVSYAAGGIATAMSLVGVPVIPSLLKSTAKQVDELRQRMPDRKPLNKQKEEINNILRNKKTHLVVMIDDLDRLDKEELHAVFRLIRQVADFDNTTYVLAMDEHIVAKSLGAFYGEGGEEDGHKFLEKIVQIPVVLPALKPKVLRTDIASIAEPYMANHADEDKEKLQDLLGRLFTTRRELIRYVNQLQYVYHLVGPEVNHFDLCLLEAVKVCSPEAYQLIFENKEHLCGIWQFETEQTFPAGFDEGGDNKDRESVIKDIVAAIPDKRSAVIKEILEQLFPINLSVSQNVCEAKKRIGSSLYFDRYFMQCVIEGYLTDTELDECAVRFVDAEEEDIIQWVNEKLDQYEKREVWRALTMLIHRQPNSTMLTQMAIKLMKCLPLTNQAKDYGYSTIEDEDSFVLHMTNEWVPNYVRVTNSETLNFEPDTTAVLALWEYWMEVSPLPYCMSLIGHAQDVLSGVMLDKPGLKNTMNRFATRMESEGEIEFDRYAAGKQERWIQLWKNVDEGDLKAYFAKKIQLSDFDVKAYLAKFNKGSLILDLYRLFDFCLQDYEKRILADYPKWEDDELLRNVVLNARMQRGEG